MTERLMHHAMFAAAMAAALLGGCKKDEAPSGAGSTASAKSQEAPSFDASARQAKLQGEWSVGSSDRESFRLTIKGDDVTLVDLRLSAQTTLVGKLLLPASTRFDLKLPEGSTYHYAMFEAEGKLHFGTGTAVEVTDLEAFTIELGMFEEKLIRTGEGCTWTKSFGEKVEKKVTCSLEEKDGKRTFRFQTFDHDQPSDRELRVVGKLLVSEDLLDAVMTRTAKG